MNELFHQISSLDTEQINRNSVDIDVSSTDEILRIINEEDKRVALAVEKEIPNIKSAVDLIVNSFNNNGRLIYIGAGTSGRLGILDASECPPTFGADAGMVLGLIAGGRDAVFKAKEGAEDFQENGSEDVKGINFEKNDVLCGLAASGRTPYVLGGIKEAKSRGGKTILITTVNREQAIKNGAIADILICPNVGPEVVMGSTRMKSGTAQKLVLNMITTTAMVRLGKTYENVMIDLQMTNEKLVQRAIKILMMICGIGYSEAEGLLKNSDGHVKTAIVMQKLDCSKSEAIRALEKSNNFVRKAITG